MIDGAQYLRRDLMIRFVRSFDKGTLEHDLDRIPIQLRPQNDASSRCCVYHDRAVLKYRLMNLLGRSCIEETDEAMTLTDYLRLAREGYPISGECEPLSVCRAGCSGCPDTKVVVTRNCRGCFARPCMYSCPKKAISIVGQVSTIDYSLCVKCGKCATICPYHAIVKTTIPCEEACPTGAIKKDETGHAVIDYSKCVFCGKCLRACPFGAVMERSQLFSVMSALKSGKKLVAVVAPSACGQFPGRLEQLFTAISKLGFSDVMEVALGAEKTTKNEACEFQERMSQGDKLMTTSCCSAYVELVRKMYPEFIANVSSTPSPMIYASEIAREKHPDASIVFIGPCVAKRVEARRKGVDYVLSFEEIGAMLAGRKIDPMTCDDWPMPRQASASARNFARSCGVTEAVLSETDSCGGKVNLSAKFIDGIDKKTVSLLKLYASGKLQASFLEVMACQGGCVNGPDSLTR